MVKRQNEKSAEAMHKVEDKLTKKMLLSVPEEAEEMEEVEDYIESEDEELDEEDMESEMGEERSSVVHKTSGDSLFKAPTREEIKALNETQELYKSNLFKLQMEELMKEVSLTEKQKKKLEVSLHRFKGVLDTMKAFPSKKAMGFEEYRKAFAAKEIQVPWLGEWEENAEIEGIEVNEDDKEWKFTCGAPSAVHLIGSFLLKTCIKEPKGITVDLAVDMPAIMFEKKDYLDSIYFKKRAIYMAYLSMRFSELKMAEGKIDGQSEKSALYQTMQFQLFQQDARRPVLIFSVSSGLWIRVLPMLDSEFFDLNRLSPTSNNLPGRMLSLESQPTGKYNSSLLMETLCMQHMSHLHRVSLSCAGFNEASVLGKVWLTQRGFGHGQMDAFNGFLFSMIMSHLLSDKTPSHDPQHRLKASYSSYQLFRLTLDFIARHDFHAHPLVMHPHVTPAQIQAFQKVFEIVMIDPSGRLNMAAHVSKGVLSLLQIEAKRTLKALKDSQEDHFRSIFLTNWAVPEAQFDFCFSVNASSHVTKGGKTEDMNEAEFLASHLTSVLMQVLRDRVTHVHGYRQGVPCWNPSVLPVLPNQVLLFVNGNPTTMLNQVEHGPSPTLQEESTQFKKWWGDKADLRRFKDGRILNAVVWDTLAVFEEKALILPGMVRYLIQRHADLPPDAIRGSDLPMKNVMHTLLSHPVTRKLETFKKSQETWLDVKRVLMALDLPLLMQSVTPCATALRYTSMYPPVSQDEHAHPGSHKGKDESNDRTSSELVSHCAPMEVIITFEASGRWPDDILALQEMKMAFYIRMAQMLDGVNPGSTSPNAYSSSTKQNSRSSANQITACVVDAVQQDVTQDRYLKVEYQGLIFHCRIHQDRESTLINSLSLSESNLFVKENHVVQSHIVPQLSNRIYNLCVESPFLSATIRLVKRWIASHMLRIPDLAIEMLCLYALQRDTALASPWTGMIRVLLCLSKTDFFNERLHVPLGHVSNDAQPNEKVTLETQELDAFLQSRHVSPATLTKAIFLASNVDPACLLWREGNTMMMANRVSHLAKWALEVLRDDVMSVERAFSIFQPDFDAYDAVILLQPKECPSTIELSMRNMISENAATSDSTSKMAPSTTQSTTETTQNTLNPSKSPFKNIQIASKVKLCKRPGKPRLIQYYLTELERAFGHVCVFFYDEYSGNKIGILFKPECRQQMVFKAVLPFSTEIASLQEKKMKANLRGMLSEMKMLGGSLVECVLIQ